MGKPTGFLEIERQDRTYEPVADRLKNWKEFVVPMPAADVGRQAARCMDCGIPFCHQGCPVNNQIPDWNDLVYRDRWREAIDRLHATNNFPEFTGRLCPAPCEAACVLGINQDPVTIKQVEVSIIDRAWDEGWVVPVPPSVKTGKTVAKAKVEGMPRYGMMTYVHNGHQYVMVQAGPKLLAMALPDAIPKPVATGGGD